MHPALVVRRENNIQLAFSRFDKGTAMSRGSQFSSITDSTDNIDIVEVF